MITKNFVISYQKSRLLKFRFPFTSTTTAVLGKHFTELPGNMKQIALFTAFRSVYPCFNEVEGGILVSHCPSVRPSGSLALDRVLSALHLSQHYLDLIHIYICYPATSGVLCVETVNNGMARLSDDLSAEVMLIFQIRCSFKNVKMQLAPERSSKILVWYIDCVYSL